MSDHLSPRKLPSSHSTMSNHLGLPFYLPFQTYQVFFGKFTDSVNLFLTAIDDWHSRQVLVMGCVSLSRMPLLYQSSETCQVVFWTFLKIFYFFFVQSLFFVSSHSWWEQGHYTQVLHFRQAFFWTFLNISSRWIQNYLTINKQGQKFFSALARMEMKYVIVYVEINVKGKQ